MNYYEKPGNTAARRCNGAERSKWRDHGVDPDLLTLPTTTSVESSSVAEPAALGRYAMERSFNPDVFLSAKASTEGQL